jgi:hypothetical protein
VKYASYAILDYEQIYSVEDLGRLEPIISHLVVDDNGSFNHIILSNTRHFLGFI